jgi:hypothetical protein
MKHLAMYHDWHHSTPALINFNKELAENIPWRYKELVTAKTASLLWMVENWIGPEKFHQALIKYINKRYPFLLNCRLQILFTYIHTYQSRFSPEGIAKASQIFLRDVHVLPKLLSYLEYYRRDRW